MNFMWKNNQYNTFKVKKKYHANGETVTLHLCLREEYKYAYIYHPA